MLRSCFLSSIVEFPSALSNSEEKSEMFQPVRGQDGHLVFFDRQEKHKLGRGHWHLASCKFRWISFSGFREVENVSANQRSSCFSDRSEKKPHKLGRGCWDLASCQVSLNSVQRFQRRSRKCLSKPEARAAILIFRSARKKPHKVGRGRTLRSCFPSSFVEFRSAVSEETSTNVKH